jgi:hypothetical protein
MTDFDPGAEPETQEDADNYVRWCAENFNRVVSSDDTLRTYRTGFRCAAWLLVVSVAQLHLHDDVDQHREIMMNNLAGHMKVARRAERQDETLSVRDLIVSRSVLDCWTPEGEYAMNLLDAAKCACAALILQYVHPLEDLWDVDAPDVWSLILMGGQKLGDINEAVAERDYGLSYDDYAVVPNTAIIDKMNWQKVNLITRQLGGPPMSAN